MFNFILNPLKWVIEQFYAFTGYYAIAIILFTLLIKLVLLPLDIKQRKNMRRMDALKPKLDVINTRYANDPDKRNQKTMELYKKEKISPLSSCLPILIQFPILIAMVTVMNMVMRDALMQIFLDAYNGLTPKIERFLWVINIFQPDNLTSAVIPDMQTVTAQFRKATSSIVTPENVELLKANYETVMAPLMEQYAGYVNGWGILPVLSGALQFLQTKLTPQQAGAPEQTQSQKVMTYMFPIISVFFCWSFNAAFALYWVVSSLFSIIQTLIINWYYKRKDQKDSEGVQIS